MSVSRLPARLDTARQALAECRSDFERICLRDEARAVKAAALILGRRDIATEAAIFIAEAERVIVQANPPEKRGPKTEDNFVLQEDETLPASTLRNMRQAHAGLTDDGFKTLCQVAREDQSPVTRAFLRAAGKGAHVERNAGVNEWYTPPGMIEAARSVLGAIDLDPASSTIAQRTIQAARYLTIDDDGLKVEWAGRVWMNPPYAKDLIGAFVEKLIGSPEITAWITLTNNATETAWGAALLGRADAVCFVTGRVRFLDPAGVPGAPLQGQMVCARGIDRNRFVEQFSVMGPILCQS